MLGHQNLSSQMYGEKHIFWSFLLFSGWSREKTELYHVSISESLQGAMQ